MSEVPTDVKNRLPVEVERVIDAQLVELRKYREDMNRHQAAIDRLKAESAVITECTNLKLAEIRQMLDRFRSHI